LVASVCACAFAAMKAIPAALATCAAGLSDHSKVWTGGIEFSASGPKDVAGTGFSVAAGSGVTAAGCCPFSAAPGCEAGAGLLAL